MDRAPGVPVWTYNDYWGSFVSVFDLPEPHDDLVYALAWKDDGSAWASASYDRTVQVHAPGGETATAGERSPCAVGLDQRAGGQGCSRQHDQHDAEFIDRRDFRRRS